jgi:hypothetical protein
MYSSRDTIPLNRKMERSTEVLVTFLFADGKNLWPVTHISIRVVFGRLIEKVYIKNLQFSLWSVGAEGVNEEIHRFVCCRIIKGGQSANKFRKSKAQNFLDLRTIRKCGYLRVADPVFVYYLWILNLLTHFFVGGLKASVKTSFFRQTFRRLNLAQNQETLQHGCLPNYVFLFYRCLSLFDHFKNVLKIINADNVAGISTEIRENMKVHRCVLQP